MIAKVKNYNWYLILKGSRRRVRFHKPWGGNRWSGQSQCTWLSVRYRRAKALVKGQGRHHRQWPQTRRARLCEATGMVQGHDRRRHIVACEGHFEVHIGWAVLRLGWIHKLRHEWQRGRGGGLVVSGTFGCARVFAGRATGTGPNTRPNRIDRDGSGKCSFIKHVTRDNGGLIRDNFEREVARKRPKWSMMCIQNALNVGIKAASRGTEFMKEPLWELSVYFCGTPWNTRTSKSVANLKRHRKTDMSAQEFSKQSLSNQTVELAQTDSDREKYCIFKHLHKRKPSRIIRIMWLGTWYLTVIVE